ncbi:c-type cytochrome [Zavarzinia compransoris]|uniref:Cytochrome c family protein n=1 Tax=Zavarzinia compransoris TaxID=1264899 RepID=A0A317E914_9PROT|nr:cytochrome c family protein [Zavarzinia compransoris]PWR21803.1 cytochrome c family protein [Zavarzinia compransoris]TDP45398.1 cytochrome c [Zavarzinia compransoris]
MDSFEFNKIAGAVLGSVLALMIVGNIGNALVSPHKLEKPVYVVEGVETEAAAGGEAAAAAAPEDPPVETLLAGASVENGQKQFAKCASCHTVDKGGAAKVGPNLYGIVGASHGHAAGFAYSDAIKGIAGPWDYKALYEFIRNPKAYAPGTKMGFAGLKKPQDRADLIAYLRAQADSPAPLP